MPVTASLSTKHLSPQSRRWLERKRREAEFVEQHKRAAPKPTPDHISLRDWFAGQALPVLLQQTPITFHQDRNTWEIRATYMAYEVADAMLKERNKP